MWLKINHRYSLQWQIKKSSLYEICNFSPLSAIHWISLFKATIISRLVIRHFSNLRWISHCRECPSLDDHEKVSLFLIILRFSSLSFFFFLKSKGRILWLWVSSILLLFLNSKFSNSIPHPSENVINVRIQMYGTYPLPFILLFLYRFRCADKLSSFDALLNALTELDKVCEAVEDDYIASLRRGTFERWDEKRWRSYVFLWDFHRILIVIYLVM